MSIDGRDGVFGLDGIRTTWFLDDREHDQNWLIMIKSKINISMSSCSEEDNGKEM